MPVCTHTHTSPTKRIYKLHIPRTVLWRERCAQRKWMGEGYTHTHADIPMHISIYRSIYIYNKSSEGPQASREMNARIPFKHTTTLCAAEPDPRSTRFRTHGARASRPAANNATAGHIFAGRRRFACAKNGARAHSARCGGV